MWLFQSASAYSRCYVCRRCYSGLSHPFKRGHQRLTFRQYASYSAPNFRRSVGSSYRITNRCTHRKSGDGGWPVLFMRVHRNVSRMWVCHNSSRLAFMSWLLCDPGNSIAESDQIFPDQVVDDQRGGKHNREKCVVDLHHSEIGEAVVCGMQKAQAAAKEESRRGNDEGQNSTVNPERQACARARSQVQHVPQARPGKLCSGRLRRRCRSPGW